MKKIHWRSTLKVYDSIINITIAILFAGMILLLFGQVVSRYFLNFPIMWSEEVGRYIFIWIVYLGAAIAFTRKRHINITFLTDILPPHPKRYLELFLHLFIMFFLLFVLIYGMHYAGMNMHKPAYAILQIRMGWVYISAPIGAICMIINIIRIIPTILNPDKKD